MGLPGTLTSGQKVLYPHVQTVIAGGAAGDHTVTGIALGDRLVTVLFDTLADTGEALTDITDEFSITADDTINNAGGTDTTDGALIVLYEDKT